MNTRVKTLFLKSFNMPQACVSCGATPAPGLKRTVRWGELEKDKMTLSVDFPLCQNCGSDINIKSKRSGRIAFWVTALLSPLLCWISSMAVNLILSGTEFAGVAAGLVFLILVVQLASWLSDKIDTAGLSPEQKQQWKLHKKESIQQRKKLDRCARIVKVTLPGLFDNSNKGSVEFEFDNLLFAREFAGLNLGQLNIK